MKKLILAALTLVVGAAAYAIPAQPVDLPLLVKSSMNPDQLKSDLAGAQALDADGNVIINRIIKLPCANLAWAKMCENEEALIENLRSRNPALASRETIPLLAFAALGGVKLRVPEEFAKVAFPPNQGPAPAVMAQAQTQRSATATGPVAPATVPAASAPTAASVEDLAKVRATLEQQARELRDIKMTGADTKKALTDAAKAATKAATNANSAIGAASAAATSAAEAALASVAATTIATTAKEDAKSAKDMAGTALNTAQVTAQGFAGVLEKYSKLLLAVAALALALAVGAYFLFLQGRKVKGIEKKLEARPTTTQVVTKIAEAVEPIHAELARQDENLQAVASALGLKVVNVLFDEKSLKEHVARLGDGNRSVVEDVITLVYGDDTTKKFVLSLQRKGEYVHFTGIADQPEINGVHISRVCWRIKKAGWANKLDMPWNDLSVSPEVSVVEVGGTDFLPTLPAGDVRAVA
jgi:hypothetical protein